MMVLEEFYHLLAFGREYQQILKRIAGRSSHLSMLVRIEFPLHASLRKYRQKAVCAKLHGCNHDSKDESLPFTTTCYRVLC
ncbi:hypothetical protein PsorP6_012202 [Peronosclerospora sorghi]|uniref:Uncharacterized protein n=1 Tax=Peronosclerospora sorghi TaxID=230839 RepID=A0ACC0WLJ6_9STRA|nr:hypothetical protein PsorP6_012202 [Peronosclerospora sorghi]